MPRASVARRYLALIFPWLPIERLRATRPHLFVARDEAPAVFTETVSPAVRIVAVDPLAARAGLAPGLTLVDARARVPGLEAFPADPHADLDWLEALAEGCMRYSPTVALIPPDGLVIDIAGCTPAFDGERPLAADVEARLARRGVLARHAFGDTAEVALALARYAGAPAPDEKSAVRRLPVTALALDADDAAALARAGLKTVGDVMARPPGEVAARFGAEAAGAVRRLSGEVEAPLKPWSRAAPLATERRFAAPIARTDQVLQVIAELVAEAAGVLETRHRGGRRWRARLFRADGHVQPLAVETAQPTRDVPLLMRLFAERIDALADPLDLGFAFDLIRLDIALTERLDAAELQLEGGVARQDQTVAPADRLATRRGRERARRSVPRDDPIPEQTELSLPAAQTLTAAIAWPQPGEGESPSRPIYLFDPPQPIDSVMAEVPDGPPHRFRWRRRIHEVARVEGPERIAGGWWRRHDAAIPVRDYYRVEDRRGRRFWIFRHDLHTERDHPRWYLHGLFA